jgi:hypothetical protein
MNRWFEEFLLDSDVKNSAKDPKLPTDKTDKTSYSDLETRLCRHGVSIAVDKKTGCALLVFSQTDVVAVRDVATVHQPFKLRLTDAPLTEAQRSELERDLDYYDRVRRDKFAEEISFREKRDI